MTMESEQQMDTEYERSVNADNNSVLLATEEEDFISEVEKNIPVELLHTLKASSFTQKFFVGVLGHCWTHCDVTSIVTSISRDWQML